jgi:hypothetical protein
VAELSITTYMVPVPPAGPPSQNRLLPSVRIRGVASADDLPLMLARRHLRFGWWSLLAFAAFGLVLETLHGFKVGAYLDVSSETRRLMWTLAHAHGVLIGAVHVLFALSLRTAPELGGPRLPHASRALIGASLLLPGGFLLAGVRVYAGDPGLGILLVPVGAVLLLAGLGIMALAAGGAWTAAPAPRRPKGP